MSEPHRLYNLVIGLSGPYGSGCSSVAEELTRILNDWPGCKAIRIQVSKLISIWSDKLLDIKDDLDGLNDTDRRKNLQQYGNLIRSKIDKEAVGHLIVHEIYKIGKDIENSPTLSLSIGTIIFIIDSLKNFNDLVCLRKVYKDEFFFCFVNSNNDIRWQRMRNYRSWSDKRKSDFQKLDDIDSDEKLVDPNVGNSGQQVKKLSSHADYYFVNNSTRENLQHSVSRLTHLLFGHGINQPTNDERCMHLAFSSANSSACLSRQVGAAIFTSDGNILAVGHNDVPRSKGGLYTIEDGNDHRCLNVGDRRCINDTNKEERFNNLTNSICDKLLEEFNSLNKDRVKEIISSIVEISEFKDATEYCRAVHAEMDALLSVCRNLSGSTIGSTVYVTTQPCHNCVKHLICAGVSRVVYIEPYPKSLGEELHSDAITLNPQSENNCEEKTAFVPYQGIAPKRFHDIFNMDVKRKEKDGRMCYTDKNTLAFSPKFSKKTEKRSRVDIANVSGIFLNELKVASFILGRLDSKGEGDGND
ncbi:MAG: deaminase [Desulfobulbus sp.]|nr:deaminase [Desulfobulbus sp.]